MSGMDPSRRIVIADRGDAGRRLDLVVRRHITDINRASRTRVQKWIENGQVTVNGRRGIRVSARAALGDVVAVDVPAEAIGSPAVMRAEPIEISILYEDDHLLAVDKPA